MGLGLSVEFTAHFAAAFSLGKGLPGQRLGEAMAHTFPALMDGAISTLLSILPLAFYPALFIVKYLFGIFAMVVAVGLLNGMVFVPALLALLGPLLKVCGRGGEQGTTGAAQPPDVMTTGAGPTILQAPSQEQCDSVK